MVEDARLAKASLLAGAVLAGSCSIAFATTCESLVSAKIPDTTITSAKSIPAGTYTPPGSSTSYPDLPAFCRVTATISPVADSSIGIELWLPKTAWNGRYQQVGSHGWGGVIEWGEMAPQLQKGFATGATDDGHVNNTTNPFYVGWEFGHRTKLIDYAWRAVHQLAEKAKLVIADYYGNAPQYTYFNGCSNGGRQGLIDAHDFPNDFNGVLIGGTASNATHGGTEQLVVSINLKNSGIEGTKGADILTLVQNAATKACGEVLNGVNDGLIIDPERCHWDPHTLVCKQGQDRSTCITPAQADAIAADVAPLRDPVTGQWEFSGMSRGSEFNQLAFGYNEGLAPYAISLYQVAYQDPNWDGSTFNLHDDLPVLDKEVGVVNLTNTDFSDFAAAGGKLIQWHGWADAAFMPGWETLFYDSVVDVTGGGSLKDVQDSYRLFMMPSVGHCGTGPGPDDIGAENQTPVSPDPEHDAVAALQDWVENGVAPQKFIATGFKVDDDPSSGIEIQRPICPYPAQAIYNGSGNIHVASNFHCGTVH
jgi:feruloyl esterase